MVNFENSNLYLLAANLFLMNYVTTKELKGQIKWNLRKQQQVEKTPDAIE